MVRKTVASVKTTTEHTETTAGHKDTTFDIEAIIKKLWNDLQDNRMSVLGFLLLFIGLVQLREFIIGVIFLTLGIMLISGFFVKK
jgi:maltodextrin utilization protein YvdJ